MLSSGLFIEGIDPVVNLPLEAQPASDMPIAATQTAVNSRREKLERIPGFNIDLIPRVVGRGNPTTGAPQYSFQQ
jgi:hypothetical protein